MTKVDYTFFTKELINQQFDELISSCMREPKPSYEEIIANIQRILVNRVIPAQTYDTDSPSHILWRVSTQPDFEPDKFESYSHPPTQPVNRCTQQRANLEGYPVLYTSIDPHTAMAEVKDKLKENSTCYLSKWSLDFTRPVVIHYLMMNTYIYNNKSVLSGHVGNDIKGFMKMVENAPEQFQEGFLQSLLRMGDMFTTPSTDLYHITSAYAHDLLYVRSKEAVLDGIMYPSVENNQNSMNFVFHPSLIEEGIISLQEVYELTITKNSIKDVDSRVTFETHRKGVYNNGVFEWETPSSKIIEKDYSEAIIETYSNHVFKGDVGVQKQLKDTNGATCKDLIERYFNSPSMIDHLFELNLEPVITKDDSDEFFKSKLTYKYRCKIPFEHGNQIEVPNGNSCIKNIYIPITWVKGFIAN